MTSAIKLRNGKTLLSTEAPGGIYNAAQLKQIAQLCESDATLVKATEDQRLAIIIPTEQVAQVTEQLKSVGIGVRGYQEGLHQPTACIGELCAESEQDALGDAMEISAAIEKIALKSSLKIGVNGCARCCVPCHTLDIAIVGETAGYRISLGGKNSQIPEFASYMAEGIPAAEIAGIVAKVVQAYSGLANEGESLQEVMERCGGDMFVAALAPYSQDAATTTADSENTVTEDFSDIATGEAEMIDDDLPLKKDDEANADVDIDPREFMDGKNLGEDLDIAPATPSGDAGADISPNWSEDIASMEPEMIEDTPAAQTSATASSAEADLSISESDLAEELINESDLAPAPAADEESDLEDKLNLAIAEEEQIGVPEDDTAEERAATMRLVEQVAEEPIVEEANDAMMAAEFGTTPEFEAENDFAALDAVEASDGADSSEVEGVDHSEWMLNGVDINASGKLVVKFSSGATMELNAAQIMREGKPRSFNFGGANLTISPARKGLKVACAGMELFVPVKANAAA